MEKHNLIIKGIEKSWNDEDLNRYIDELMQEARKETIEEFEKMIEKYKWKLKDIDNKDIDNAIHYSGNEVFMDLHNEDLEELKQQLSQLGDK